MVFMRRLSALVTFIAVVSSCRIATAQTCASPVGWQPDPKFPPSLVIDTCTGDNSGASLICGGVHDRVGPMYVLRSTFVNANQTATQVTLSGGGPGFDPVMYMTSASGGCGANQETCFPSGDTGFPMSVVGIPDGDWLILVTAFDQNAPGSCGQVALGTNGSFPVTLEHFSID
jgi:hypothetical protein